MSLSLLTHTHTHTHSHTDTPTPHGIHEGYFVKVKGYGNAFAFSHLLSSF